MKFSLLILFFIVANCSAQQRYIDITVCDSANKLPLELVNIHVLDSKKGTVSNKLGKFNFWVKDGAEIELSALGYKSKITIAHELIRDTIYLATKTIELDELKIYSTRMSANDIVRMAMGRTSKLSFSKPYSLNTFYRHSCSENDVYGRLIEAAVVLHDNKGHKKKYDSPSEKIGVEVNQIRRSFDFTKNFDEHDPISIYSTLKYDVYSYTSFLHFYPEDFNFQLVDTTFYDNALVWVIAYEYSRQKEKSLNEDLIKCQGQIFIRANDFGVLEINESQEHIRKSEFEVHSYELEWKVKYQEHDGKYFLKYISEKGKNIDVLKSTSHDTVSAKDHAFQVEIMVSDLQFENLSKVSSKEPDKLTLDKIGYDNMFWRTYTVIQATPLDEKIIKDLELRQSLETQFEK